MTPALCSAARFAAAVDGANVDALVHLQAVVSAHNFGCVCALRRQYGEAAVSPNSAWVGVREGAAAPGFSCRLGRAPSESIMGSGQSRRAGVIQPRLVLAGWEPGARILHRPLRPDVQKRHYCGVRTIAPVRLVRRACFCVT